ncbi:MAG: mechanosensitive ion channel domain-containing protein [Chitinophagaceae bacterium]
MSLSFFKKSIGIAAALLIMVASCKPADAQSRLRNTRFINAALKSSDSTMPELIMKVASYTSTIDRTSFFLNRKFDVTQISLDLPDIEKRVSGFKRRLEERGSQMNLRSLNSGLIILKEISRGLSSDQSVLTDYSRELTSSNAEIKKILNDTFGNIPSTDTILSEQIEDIHEEGRKLDVLQQKSISKVNLLRNRISLSLLQATDIISDMQYLTTALKLGMWGREQPPLLNIPIDQYKSSFAESAGLALKRSVKIIGIYLNNNWNTVILGLLVFLFFTIWIGLNLRRIRLQENAQSVFLPMHFLSKNLLVGCLMALFTYLPFFFGNAPMSLMHTLELLRLIALSWLLYPYLTERSKVLWIVLSVLWIVYAWDDLLIDSSFGERWELFISGIALGLICIKILSSKKPNFINLPESPVTKALLIFTLAQVTLSIYFNITGRASLAKIFGVSAIQCLMLGISLKIFCTMVLEAIYLQSEAYQDSRFSDFIDFKNMQDRFLRTLWILAILAFTFSLSRNLTLFDAMTNTLASVFNKTRSVGSMAFTFKSVAVFIFIIWISSTISGIINFFFGNNKTINTGKRNRIGSMMLLIRLATWTIGFSVAVAAAGVPVSKLSIMLGALGVGIGFGLQNIVNNLVSGIILAFERPLQIGDTIEVAGKIGVVKEIGVRSSKISNNEGADIIIPNGDLLSQHVTNWTLHDRQRRVEFTIGIPYQIDVKQVKLWIVQALAGNEKIMQDPAPSISLQQFGNAAIEIQIQFWINEIAEASSIRSNAMIAVYDVLLQNGIQFPHPAMVAAPEIAQGN